MTNYKKQLRPIDLKNGYVDVYSVLELFEVDSHAIGHAIKKLLMAGKRGAKGYRQDLHESIMAIERVTDDIAEGKAADIKLSGMPKDATHYDSEHNKWYMEKGTPLCNKYFLEWCQDVKDWNGGFKNPAKEFINSLTKVEDL